MNFTKLLAAGKSLVGMKDQDCPYRMNADSLLPKFEAAKNPFASTIKAGSKIEYNSNRLPVATVAPAPVQPAIMETRPLFAADYPPVNVPNARLISIPASIAISVVAEKTEMPEPIEIKIATPEPAPTPAPVPVAVAEPAAKALAKSAVTVDAVAAATTESPFAPAPKAAPRAPRSWPFPGWLKKVNPFSGRDRNPPKTRAPMQFELSLDRIKVIRNDLHDSDVELVSPTISVKPAGKTARLQTLAKNEATALGRMTAKFFGVEETQVR